MGGRNHGAFGNSTTAATANLSRTREHVPADYAGDLLSCGAWPSSQLYIQHKFDMYVCLIFGIGLDSPGVFCKQGVSLTPSDRGGRLVWSAA